MRKDHLAAIMLDIAKLEGRVFALENAALATPPAGQDAPVDAPISVGDLVHYHPVIGEPHDGRVYRVRDVCDIPSIKGAIWLEGKSGCVHPEAVSRASHPPAPDASDLPTIEEIEKEVFAWRGNHSDLRTTAHLIRDLLRADRARRVVGVPVERLREALDAETCPKAYNAARALLAEYAWKEAQP